MDWPTAAVLIAIVIALMAVLSTYIAAGTRRSELGAWNARELNQIRNTRRIDGSAESEAAIRWAAGEAVMRDTPVTLMHVVAPVVVSWPVAPVQASITEWQEENARNVIEHAQKTLLASVGESEPPEVRTEVKYAGVVTELSNATKEAQMVVVGSRGMGLPRPSHSGLCQQRPSSITRIARSRSSMPTKPRHPTTPRRSCWASTAHPPQRKRPPWPSTKHHAEVWILLRYTRGATSESSRSPASTGGNTMLMPRSAGRTPGGLARKVSRCAGARAHRG